MLTLTQTLTLTLIPTLALTLTQTLTQTEEKHYYASRGKIATSLSLSRLLFFTEAVRPVYEHACTLSFLH